MEVTKMSRIRKLRIAVARMVMTIHIPTVIYVLFKLSDPDYCPAIGWVFGFIVLTAFACWSVKYSELFIKLPE
jgi:hypothetical protein